MKINIKFSIFFILIVIFLMIFIGTKVQQTMLNESTLNFAILPNKEKDAEMQINIRLINNMRDKKSNKNKLMTLFKDGIFYPLDNKQDFPMYELFIKKNNQFTYIASENIYFSEDDSSIRAKSGRKGIVFISPNIEKDTVFLEYHQYHGNNHTQYSKRFKLSDSYKYNSRFFDEQTSLDDFSQVNIQR